MKKIYGPIDFKGIEDELRFIESQKFVGELEELIDKQDKIKRRRIIRLILMLAPVITGVNCFIVFNSPLAFAVGLGFSIVIVSSDFISYGISCYKDKTHLEDFDGEEYLNNVTDKNTFELYRSKNKNIVIDKADKEVVLVDETDENRIKLAEVAHEIDTFNKDINVTKNLNEYYNLHLDFLDLSEECLYTKPNGIPDYDLAKDDSNLQVVKEIDAYYNTYQLSPMEINDEDWDLLTNIIYELLANKGYKNAYYEVLSCLNRYTLANSIIHQHRIITIHDYINCISYLECNIIDREDIIFLQKYLREHVKSQKVVSIDSLKLSKNKNHK